ncbi:MAG: peptidoglycan-binding domain-containing protein [Clostridia bacterium]
MGARGNITKWLQKRLNKLGFDCGTADGIFGVKTQAAVRAFQKACKLVADGIVGVKTWSKLLGLS